MAVARTQGTMAHGQCIDNPRRMMVRLHWDPEMAQLGHHAAHKGWGPTDDPSHPSKILTGVCEIPGQSTVGFGSKSSNQVSPTTRKMQVGKLFPTSANGNETSDTFSPSLNQAYVQTIHIWPGHVCIHDLLPNTRTNESINRKQIGRKPMDR